MTYYLAFVLPAEQYGELALTQAAFSYSLYAAGLDFYLFSNRYILKNIKNLTKSSSAVFSQICVNAIGVVVISVPFFFYMNGAGFGISIIIIMLGSVLMDCLAQETTRILEIIGAQKQVSELNAIRFGAGSLLIIALAQFNIAQKVEPIISLATMYASIMATSFVAFSYGLFAINMHMGISMSLPRAYLIKSGLVNIPKYIVGTLSYRGLFSFDKLIIGAFCQKTALSWYGFICLTLSGIQLVQDTVISAYLYPKIMRFGISREHEDMNFQSKKMAYLNAISGLLLAGIGGGAIYFFKNIIPIAKHVIENLDVAILLVICYSLNATSMSYHYVLYAKNKLSLISVIHVVALIIFLILSAVCYKYKITPLSISACLVVSFLALFFLRLKFSKVACRD